MNEELTPDQTEQALEPDVEVQTDTQGDDPLDLIEGEDLRAEAKKYRSIAQRKAKVEKPEAKPEKVEVKETPFVTKSDMAKMATREALEMVGAEVATQYEELIKIPLGGFDPLDSKSIASNLKERFTILKARSPEEKGDVSGLKSTAIVSGSGIGSDKSQKKEPPNFHKRLQPEDWYPKKES